MEIARYSEFILKSAIRGGANIDKQGIRVANSTGFYNSVDPKGVQWVRITEGCSNDCPFCYEKKEIQEWELPEITTQKFKIMDMNVLERFDPIALFNQIRDTRLNGKVVYPELVCGIDWRKLTPQIARALKAARFQKIRIAWDYGYAEHMTSIRYAVNTLIDVGYSRRDIMIFIICNWEIPFREAKAKAHQAYAWGLTVSDCWFDGQVSPNIKPLGWREAEIKTFRRFIRKENQVQIFGFDPELKA